MKSKIIGLAFLAFYAPASFAGLFGPSNLEECILEKMKGQDRALYPTARAACLKQFPAEIEINRSLIKFNWCKSEINSESVCLEQKPTNIKVTKVIAVFHEDACEGSQQDKPGITVSAVKPWFGSTYKFELPDGQRKCAYFTFYGIEQ